MLAVPARMKRTLLIWFSIALVPLALVFWCWAHTESYCFFYPGIDTRYATGYSESGFNQVTTGMTAQAVQKLLGSPLHTDVQRDGRVRWCYTSDGKCSIGTWYYADFAWLGREIYFRNNRVVEVFKHVYYD